MKKLGFIFIILSFTFKGYTQNQDYLFPVNPGERNYLSGSMGELRGTHFHGGIDIKTGGAIGWPIYAAAEGYVSRIKVSPVGYGNALYLYHPAFGTTTVYGHLDKFEARIADYVKNEQYRRKSFSLDISLTKEQFPVHKGDLIAYGGNTGGSSGPHLHFEIRDEAQRPLNPLHYNFSEIIDNIRPTAQLVAIRALDTDARVNGEFQTEQYSLYRKGRDYYISEPIEAWGEIGVMVMGYDKLDGSHNRCGIPRLTMKMDGKEISSIHINQVPFNKNREIYLFRDYKLKNEDNRSFQKFYREDGCTMDIYENLSKEGIICIDDTLSHEMEIVLEDAYENQTKIFFTVTGKRPEKDVSMSHHAFEPVKQKIEENTLCFMGRREKNNGLLAEVYANRMKYEVAPSYFVNDYAIYHWDLRKGLPDSVNVCHEMIFPAFDVMAPSGKEFSFFHPYMDIYFSDRTLFDTLYLSVDYADEWDDQKEYFIIGDDGETAFRSSMRVDLKPLKVYENKSKIAAYYTSNLRNFYYQGGEWMGDKFRFYARGLGKYTLIADTIPPTLRILQQNRNGISCLIDDDLSGVDDYKVTVDGEWVLMNYDYKKRKITSEKLDPSQPFSGELVIEITDKVGNKKVYKTTI